MKRNIIFGTLFSAALAVGVAAQGTGTGSQADQQKSNQQVTVTGCLQNADVAGAAGTTGTGTSGSATSGSARSSAQFMLSNAKVTKGGSGAATSGTGTGTGTGTSGSAATGASASNRFLLTGGDQQELKKYLNSEVEVRGTLQAADRSSGGTGTGTGTGTGSATSSSRSQSDQNAQMLRVSSVKQTASTCSGGN
jgi:hypothetical protein